MHWCLPCLCVLVWVRSDKYCSEGSCYHILGKDLISPLMWRRFGRFLLWFTVTSDNKRILIVLKKTRLSRRRMIWLLPRQLPPLHPSPVSKFSLSSCVLPVKLFDGGRGRGGERRQIIRPQESVALYKLFNTLCWQPKECWIEWVYRR